MGSRIVMFSREGCAASGMGVVSTTTWKHARLDTAGVCRDKNFLLG